MSVAVQPINSESCIKLGRREKGREGKRKGGGGGGEKEGGGKEGR